jgi:hypothetical protein
MRIMILVIALAMGAGSALGATTPRVTVSPAVGTEGGRAVFTIRLARPAAKPVTVRYATGDVSARAGLDYARRTGRLTFEPGQTSKRVVVALRDDAEPEASETFTVRLSRPVNARLARASARGTIRASDLPRPFTAVAQLNAGSATATATMTFDPEVAQVRYTTSLRGLGEPTARMHLHRGAAGAEGPQLVSLATPSDNGTASGSAPMGLALILQIAAEPAGFYVDAHTQTHGTLRGQLAFAP